MKFKAIAVIVARHGAVAGYGGLGAGVAAQPQGQARAAGNGVRLQSALLPASAFGDGFTVTDRLNTGNALWPPHAHLKPSSLSCTHFETYIFVGGFGDTAGATDGFDNPNPAFADYPNVALAGDQAVLQFKTTQAAASFYNQAYARYKQCSDFTESDPADNLQLELTSQSLASTTIARNKAFQLTQLAVLSSTPARFYE